VAWLGLAAPRGEGRRPWPGYRGGAQGAQRLCRVRYLARAQCEEMRRTSEAIGSGGSRMTARKMRRRRCRIDEGRPYMGKGIRVLMSFIYLDGEPTG
jgi:hypothetical protein